MGKEWTVIRTDKLMNTKENTKLLKNFNDKIRNTKSLPIEELKKQSKNHYDEKIAKEEQLLAAVDEKRCKSPKLIKEAEIIKEARNKKDNKKEKL